MVRSMFRVWLAVGLLAVGVGCSDDAPDPTFSDVATYSATVPVEWFGLILDLTRTTPGYTPPVASRTFGYAGTALYEALLPGMPAKPELAGQLNGFQAPPKPESGDRYHWPTVANSALATMARLFYPTTSQANKDAIDDLEAEILAGFAGAVDAAVLERSVSRGRAVANHVYAWSVSDGGHEGWTRNFPADYTPPVGAGLWVPTPRSSGNPQSALQPYWGGCRPFTLPPGDPNLLCDPGAPTAYSTDPASLFYEEAVEVYDAVENATAEEIVIARFWSDDPGATATPPGHSISILNQVLTTESSNLEEAAEAYALVGIAVADAFIACWQSKYKYNLLRPVTYVREVLGHSTWLPLLETPPFPEYTSGHSVQSGAAFGVLEALFGENYAFTDHTHDGRGFTPRNFDSFDEAAEEAAISRLYGGIHYRPAIHLGVDQGRCVAQRVLQLRGPTP